MAKLRFRLKDAEREAAYKKLFSNWDSAFQKCCLKQFHDSSTYVKVSDPALENALLYEINIPKHDIFGLGEEENGEGWKSRLKVEYRELLKKHKKLTDFMRSRIPEGIVKISEAETGFMYAQSAAMLLYLSMLKHRMALHGIPVEEGDAD